jgi:hypothetical protein
MLGCVAYCLGEAFFITIIHTATRNIAYDVFAKFIQAVVFDENIFDIYLFAIIFETVTPRFVFYIRMDIRIVPKNRRLNTFRS